MHVHSDLVFGELENEDGLKLSISVSIFDPTGAADVVKVDIENWFDSFMDSLDTTVLDAERVVSYDIETVPPPAAPDAIDNLKTFLRIQGLDVR